MKRIYVGNLPFSVTQEKLKELFSSFGEIEEAMVVTNKFSGRSKGFGFVTFVEETSVAKAIADMDQKEIEGRKLIVKEAIPFDPDKPRTRFEGRGGFGDRGPRRDFDSRGPRRENRFRRDTSEGAPSEEESTEQEN